MIFPVLIVFTPGSSGHRKYRSKTPEILLSPHQLDNSRDYYDYYDPRWRNGPSYHPQGSVEPSGSPWDRTYTVTSASSKGGGGGGVGGGNFKSYRSPSDIDSQISLPRSYTLPREFKYKKPKSRKAIRTEHFIHSTNSSDGNCALCAITTDQTILTGCSSARPFGLDSVKCVFDLLICICLNLFLNGGLFETCFLCPRYDTESFYGGRRSWIINCVIEIKFQDVFSSSIVT